MKDRYVYPAVFDYADDGISIEFPDLPGAITCGDTDEEALYMAKDENKVNYSHILQDALKEYLGVNMRKKTR
ncbi:type II toxin-antitoxin system HicB family antitoxin [Paenibacillus antibioticophila]|uniref:type II toxin-antitoxin system HicB family antitoxin n=1 Tax=Paenibacillus antibioticophila TaxID=1274374 RepID=UPI0005C97890|nr:type II toxin-antitoxin system HicB family antitoxin [Paenibacillus antibioticophila]